MQKLKQELNANPVGATSSRPCFQEMTLKDQKGITLIALIITIIVMLILVGVTINVALNGGLFTKAEQATYQMEASMVKEQFEIAKAVAISNNGGEKLEDYSTITIDSLDLDANTKNKYKDKIFMSAEGDVCYNPAVVIDAEERIYLGGIGINEYKTTQTVGFYGVGYTSEGITLYFFNDGIGIYKVGEFFTGFKYTKSEGTISIPLFNITGTVNESNYALILDGEECVRNESDVFSYKPTQDATYKIYSNALYVSDETDTVIATPSESLAVFDGLNCSFSEMETNGVTVLDDTGKTISYNNVAFTLIEMLE